MKKEWLKESADVGIAVGTTVLICLLSVLLFAFVVKIAALDGDIIAPVNRIIQSVAVFLGCVVGIKGEHGLLKGLSGGILSAVLTYVLFSWMGGAFVFTWIQPVEWLLYALAGGISGIIAVNIRK